MWKMESSKEVIIGVWSKNILHIICISPPGPRFFFLAVTNWSNWWRNSQNPIHIKTNWSTIHKHITCRLWYAVTAALLLSSFANSAIQELLSSRFYVQLTTLHVVVVVARVEPDCRHCFQTVKISTLGTPDRVCRPLQAPVVHGGDRVRDIQPEEVYPVAWRYVHAPWTLHLVTSDVVCVWEEGFSVVHSCDYLLKTTCRVWY